MKKLIVVQFSEKVLVRLYLMITLGAVYIAQTEDKTVKQMLGDLLEMCKGVQHPVRGLFLRNYLSQVSKDRLLNPIPGLFTSEDGIRFVLANFTQMNRLWIRMQRKGQENSKLD